MVLFKMAKSVERAVKMAHGILTSLAGYRETRERNNHRIAELEPRDGGRDARP
jgi:hypothetical protein